MKAITVILAAAALAACAPEARDTDELTGPRVSVQGEAKVDVVPDMLTVELSVTQLAVEVAQAAESGNRRTAAA